MSKVKYISLCMGLIAAAGVANAEMMPAGPNNQVDVNFAGAVLDDDILTLNYTVNPHGVKMPSKYKTVYIPTITDGDNTVLFESFAISGEKRWYHNSKEGDASAVTFKGWSKKSGELLTPFQGPVYNVAQDNGTYTIAFALPYIDWMGDAIVGITCVTYGCTSCAYYSQDVTSEAFYPMFQTDFKPLVFEPEIQYLTPAAEAVKQRNLTSRAYLDFKVGQTTILPKYMNNPKEIAKMEATIDSINNDPDMTITSINIRGYASPEGPYENNVRLAKGRTEALKNFLIKDYKLGNDFITTKWEPAINWEGLREWLDNNTIDNKAAILDIVNSNLGDFDKNQKIKTTYPTQYNYLLKEVYPSLRVSEYTLNFEVKGYDTAEEIIEVMETAPNKLSVEELFVAGSSQGTDSEVFAQAVQIAVNTYPDDPEANLNAGLLAMQQGDLNQAEKYLKKAGDSDEAKLARAQLDALKGENHKALDAFKKLEKSSNANVASAATNGAALIEKILKRNK